MSSEFYDVHLTATIIVNSALQIGASVQTYNHEVECCKDTDDNPYFPASTIKGSMLDFAPTALMSEDIGRVFGKDASLENSITNDGKQSSMGGQVMFLDALLDTENSPQKDKRLITRKRNSIDPITGTAKEHHLYETELVAPDCRFTLSLKLSKATKEQLNQLTALVADWGQSFQLGRGENNNQGQCKLLEGSLKITGQTANQLITWLNDTTSTKTNTPANLFEHGVNKPTASKIKDTQWFSIDICLTPISPVFTFNKTVSKQCNSTNVEFATFDSVGAGNNLRQIIHPSSIRGALRGQAVRILNTLQQRCSREELEATEQQLTALFGSENCAANLKITPFIAKSTDVHDQNFIGIDRFTGGVADQHNYNIERPYSQKLKGQLQIRNQLISLAQQQDADPNPPKGSLTPQQARAAITLLLFLLRDLIDGEILLGGLKAKGFGQVQACIAQPKQNTDYTA
ncbi:MAG: RAMP superfamily CRISPR-associated protein, partial [Pontibacterium sp.]